MENIRNLGMIKICNRLKSNYNIDMSKMIALSFYAREGSWQTSIIAEKVKKIYAWEVDEKFKIKLKNNLPKNADIKIGDSFVISLDNTYRNKFDVLVFDNPAGCYGSKKRDSNELYCEHFEALELVPKLINNNFGIVIFNIKSNPFNYVNFPEWQKRRNSYYGVKDASNLDIDFLKDFYDSKFKDMGFSIKFSFLKHRMQQADLYALTIGLEKK